MWYDIYMKLEHISAEIVKKEIRDIVEKYLDLKIYKVFVFGSRVTGKSHERSDIDIGIKGPEAIPLATMGAIREDIEKLPHLYTIEVIDFMTVAPEFEQHAKEHIEEL